MGMEEMLGDYRRTLCGLYRRREELSAEMGQYGRRLAVLDEEIDELEEAVMHLRRYAAPRAQAV